MYIKKFLKKSWPTVLPKKKKKEEKEGHREVGTEQTKK